MRRKWKKKIHEIHSNCPFEFRDHPPGGLAAPNRRKISSVDNRGIATLFLPDNLRERALVVGEGGGVSGKGGVALLINYGIFHDLSWRSPLTRAYLAICPDLLKTFSL